MITPLHLTFYPAPAENTGMPSNRLEAFSDGVIAIIITIMVLEMKVPHGTDAAALAGVPSPPTCFHQYLGSTGTTTTLPTRPPGERASFGKPHLLSGAR